MFKLFKYLKPYVWQVLVLLAAISLQVWTSLQLPALMADIVNRGIMQANLGYVWQTGLWMIAFAFLTSACAFLANLAQYEYHSRH